MRGCPLFKNATFQHCPEDPMLEKAVRPKEEEMGRGGRGGRKRRRKKGKEGKRKY